MAKRALIIDDSQTMRQLESLYLKQLGFEVDDATDAASGLAKLGPAHAVVISDLNMPGMNGLELIRRIRSGTVNKNVPVVMISTESSTDFQVEAKSAGVSAWLQKPFTAASLATVIKRLVPEGDG